MAYKQLPMVEVSVNSLALDLDNYRIPITPDDEAAALKYLFASEDVVGQARLFLRDGYFDNEVPVVVKESQRHVVLEGNRRVSALKAIKKPDLVPEHEHEVQELLTRYAAEAADMPTKIRVIVAPSREVARPHIARLHTGLSKRSWSRDQQARYYDSLLGPGVTVDDLKALYPSVDVVRFLRMVQMRHFLDGVKYKDRSLREFVRSDKLAMSAFEYAYRPKAIAAAMGAVFDGHRLTPTHKNPETIAATLTPVQRAAVEYLMKGFRAGTFNTRSPEFKKGSDEQVALLAVLLGTEPAPPGDPGDHGDDDGSAGSRVGAGGSGEGWGGRPGGGTGASDGAPGGGGGPGPRGPNHPDTRKGLHIGGLPLDEIPSNLVKRYLELRKIDLAETPAAAAMLLRSVLEATIKWHFSSSSTLVSGELGSVFPAVVTSYGKRRAHKDVINTISSGAVAKPGSLKWFNAAAHNPNFPIIDHDVRQAYSLVESVLSLLLKPHSP